MTNHPDCRDCCQIGRCHFCGGSGKVAAHFEKDGQRFEVQLCPTHYGWAASNSRAPRLIFDEAFLSEMPNEPIRKSEAFQSAALAVSSR